MTAHTDSSSPSTLPPLGLRVAATLCAVVGVVSALAVIGLEVEMASRPDNPLLAMITNPAAVLAVLAAAVLIWQRRRLGAYLLIAAAIVPNLGNLAYGQPLRAPGLLLILALITLAENWTQLRSAPSGTEQAGG